MKMPPRTPTGKVFILKGFGMPVFQKKGKGDLRVKIRVESPGHLKKQDREMLEELARQSKMGKTGLETAPFTR